MESGCYRGAMWSSGLGDLEPGKGATYCGQGRNLWLKSSHILSFSFKVASLFLGLFKIFCFLPATQKNFHFLIYSVISPACFLCVVYV